MIILGIADSITSGATVVEDGKVLAAVNEERLNRQKMAMGFPRQSIEEVLRIAGLTMKDVDSIAVATNSLFWRPESTRLEDYFRKSKGLDRDLFISLGSFFARVTRGNLFSRKVYYQLKYITCLKRKFKIRQTLARTWGYKGSIDFIDHHLAHCAAAYFTSGMNESVVVSMDGAGDGSSSHVYRVSDGKFQLVNQVDSYDSIGNYYAYVTHLCGFVAHKHEGKITGLAAHGKLRYLDILRKYIAYEDGKIKNIGACFDWSAIRKLENDLKNNFDKADLAASIQYILEEVVTSYMDYWIKKAGLSNVAIAGGVFANVKLNQRVHNLDVIDKLFVHPGMGDEGLATGAALFKSFELCKKHKKPFNFETVQNVYWGPGYSASEIEKAIDDTGLSYKYYENIEEQTAQLLADGKIVSRFDGRMEYGPRALGNRSILYKSTDPTVNDWLNKKLKRTEFMPFAPVTLKQYTDKCYKNVSGAEIPAKFMTITFDCTDWMKENCPAVVHIDNTARPQIIDKEINPGYYEILERYHQKTGLPSIINTSFNMHEEPIVCTPSDALRAFIDSKLEYLAIDKFLVHIPKTS